MKRVLPAVFWAGVFFVFLTPMELGDIWWHLSTGQWIWQHRGIPAEDPFSISAAAVQGRFVLKGFWLCQLLFYGLYSLSGLQGLIVLKGAVFTLIFFIIHRLIKNFGLKGPLGYILLLPAVYLSTFYDEIRPQSLSFLFFALTVYLLEHGRTAGNGRANRSYWLLPLIMLMWSNMHPGFAIGDAVIAVYMLEALIRPGLRRPGFILSGLLSFSLSALNPNGLEAVLRTAGMLGVSIKGTAPIHEHLPVKEFASFTGESYLYHTVIAIIACGFASFIFKGAGRPFSRSNRLRGVDILHLLLFASLSYVSLKTFRAGMFLAVMGTAVIGKNLSGLKPERWLQVRIKRRLYDSLVRTAAAAAIVIVMFFFLRPRTLLTKPVLNGEIFPLKAAAFIEREALPGNIYHPYEWGGYLIWRFYPRYRVFIDGRAIGPIKEHSEVLFAKPSWKEILRRYGVNTVLYWPLFPYRGDVPPLVLALLNDDGWSPVYWDLRSVIFVRTALTERPLTKGSIWELLTSLITANIIKSPSEARNYTAIGVVYLERGLEYDAREAFRKALALDPEDREAVFWLRALE